MSDQDKTLREIAQRNGFSEGAARAMADAIRSGGGSMAQFSHPELGGMGQWSRGGMLMIGSMNDHDLKARVGRLAEDLASGGAASGQSGGGGGRPSEAERPASNSPWAQPGGGDLNDNKPAGGGSSGGPGGASASANSNGSGNWWPGDLGQPSSSGAQNGVRYAAFPSSRRLAIEQDGKVTLYDTGDHQISGVSQSQSGGSPGNLRFTSQKGDIDLAGLTKA
ncbi:hypothetical protein [Aureimonas sp. AU40]|uniref:hypothetical protein n=1 Tax=Aureimonas sp. AU40 TaxID=1637747 RepID=UPI000782BDF7|nr:hypothetical protein [Aureimonas sp. AU40]